MDAGTTSSVVSLIVVILAVIAALIPIIDRFVSAKPAQEKKRMRETFALVFWALLFFCAGATLVCSNSLHFWFIGLGLIGFSALFRSYVFIHSRKDLDRLEINMLVLNWVLVCIFLIAIVVGVLRQLTSVLAGHQMSN